MHPTLPPLPQLLTARFEPIDCIGRGASGVVYRARRLEDDRIVALKVITARTLRDPGLRRAFVREARAILRLRHRNVVELIDFDVLGDGSAYLVTEFLGGGSLSLWRRVWPGWGPILDATMDILAALAYAHARGIVHCDIKPENLLLAEPEKGGYAALADFGVARLGAHTMPAGGTIERWRTEELTGTPTYMAPEQAEGNLGGYGPWTDIYALGVVLYELVSGKPPFDAESVTGVLLRHLQEPVPPLRPREGVELLPPVTEAIERMLSKDPWDRPRFAARLRESLGALRELASELDRASLRAIPPSDGQGDFDGPPTLPGAPPDAAAMPAPLRPQRAVVMRVDQTSSGFRRVRTRELSLVGRTNELLHLRNLADAVLRDRAPQVVFLHSAPGMGKGRVVEALREALEERGLMQSWAGSYRVEAGGVGAGLRGAVEAFYLCLGLSREQTESALEARLRKLRARDPWEVGALLNWLRPRYEAPEVATTTDGAVVGLALRAARRACARDPLLVWLDDAHNAMESQVLPFVERLCQLGRNDQHTMRRAADERNASIGMPCLVIVSYRTLGEATDPSGAVRQRIDRLAEREDVSMLELGPMSRAGIAHLLVDEVGLSEPQARRIAEQTGGRPFLALQAARAAVEIGELQQQDDSDNSAELAIISDEYELAEPIRPIVISPLSSGRLLHDAVHAVLADLPKPAAVQTLGMLALLSPRTALATLRSAVALAWPRDDWEPVTEQILERAIGAGLLRWQAQDEALFLDHPPLVRVLVSELELQGALTEAHRAAAEALRRAFGEQHGAAMAARARHLEAAKRSNDAWTLMTGAITDAVVHARYRDAVVLAAEAEGWLDAWREPIDSERRGQLHRALAWAAVHCGALHQAARHLDGELARRTDDPAAMAERAHIQARIHAGRGDIANAVRAFTTARTTFQQLGDHSGLGHALLGIASAYLSQGDLGRALREAQEALKVFATDGDHRGRAATLRVLGQVYVMRGDLDRAKTSYQQSLALFGGQGDLHGTADVQRGLGGLALERGDTDAALVVLRDALSAYETIGDLQGAANALRGIARARRVKGQTDVAIADLQRAVGLCEQLGVALGVADCLLDLASVQREVGEYGQATDALEKAVTSYERAGDERGIASCLMTLGNVLLDAGRTDMAIQRHEEALRIFWRNGYERGVLLARLNLGHAHLVGSDPAKAAELLDAVEQAASAAKEYAVAATAAAYAALAAARSGDLERARACFQRAYAHDGSEAASPELGASFEQLSDEAMVVQDGAALAVEALAAAERQFEQAGLRSAQRRASRKRADLMAKLGTLPQRR